MILVSPEAKYLAPYYGLQVVIDRNNSEDSILWEGNVTKLCYAPSASSHFLMERFRGLTGEKMVCLPRILGRPERRCMNL